MSTPSACTISVERSGPYWPIWISPKSVAETMIAHKRPDLIARCSRVDLIKQRRRAAATYDAWLSGLLGLGDDDIGNVVRLPR